MKNIINIINKAIDAKVIIILILAFFIFKTYNNKNVNQQRFEYVDTVVIYTDTLLNIPQQEEENKIDTFNIFRKYLWKKIKQVI